MFCFNGAALKRARKSSRRGLLRWISTSFNGAALKSARKSAMSAARDSRNHRASMEPRSRARGNTNRSGCSLRARLLQWSRAQESAEICIEPQTNQGERKLQWGRAQESAEIQGGHPGSPPRDPLQWSRAQESAEIGLQYPAPAVIRVGFNGAALKRARKS